MKERVYRQTDMTLLLLSGILITLYLSANILSVKTLKTGNFLLFDAGTLTFPFTYVLGDTITEVWGFKCSKKIIWFTFFANLLLVLFTALAGILPGADSGELGELTAAYNRVFTYVPRLVAASLAAFLAGELANAYMMAKIRSWTGDSHLWLRAAGSSALGYILDTAVFVLIAFAFTASWREIWQIGYRQYLFKMLIDVLPGTGLTYLLVHCLSGGDCQKNRTTEQNHE